MCDRCACIWGNLRAPRHPVTSRNSRSLSPGLFGVALACAHPSHCVRWGVQHGSSRGTEVTLTSCGALLATSATSVGDRESTGASEDKSEAGGVSRRSWCRASLASLPTTFSCIRFGETTPEPRGALRLGTHRVRGFPTPGGPREDCTHKIPASGRGIHSPRDRQVRAPSREAGVLQPKVVSGKIKSP